MFRIQILANIWTFHWSSSSNNNFRSLAFFKAEPWYCLSGVLWEVQKIFVHIKGQGQSCSPVREEALCVQTHVLKTHVCEISWESTQSCSYWVYKLWATKSSIIFIYRIRKVNSINIKSSHYRDLWILILGKIAHLRVWEGIPNFNMVHTSGRWDLMIDLEMDIFELKPGIKILFLS